MTAVGIIGAGRAGQGLGLALAGAGCVVHIHSRQPRDLPPSLISSSGPRLGWLDRVEIVILAVPDAAITEAALRLAATGAMRPEHVVLHLSGVLDRDALVPLGATGAALGSLHPLVPLSTPATVRDRLRGGLAGIEGDERALRRAAELAGSLGLTPVPIPRGEKARYHAAAVFAATFPVALAALAERLFLAAGLTPELARRGTLSLMSGALENLKEQDPQAALTGPVARGDVETLRRHLAVLSEHDAEAYRALSREALELASLPPDTRAALDWVLGG